MEEIQNLQVHSIDDFRNNKIQIYKSYTKKKNTLINVEIPTSTLLCNYEIFGSNNFYMNGLLKNNYGRNHVISFLAQHETNKKYFIKLKLTEENDSANGKNGEKN